jgi:hypothetical protein
VTWRHPTLEKIFIHLSQVDEGDNKSTGFRAPSPSMRKSYPLLHRLESLVCAVLINQSGAIFTSECHRWTTKKRARSLGSIDVQHYSPPGRNRSPGPQALRLTSTRRPSSALEIHLHSRVGDLESGQSLPDSGPGVMPNSVPVDTRVLMVVLPIEPVILQRINPRETLTLHIAGKRTTVKSPLA